MRTADRNKTNQEAWKNVTPGIAAVWKFDSRGELIHEQVTGGRTLNLTPEERRINQEMCAEESLDFFKNGIFVPVRLLDSEEDIDEIKGNPNHLTEEDMKGILKANVKTFDAALAEITNAFTVRRMLEMASSEEVDISVKKMEAINAKIASLEAGPAVNEREVISGPNMP